ncbi:type II toxin-antitoxin system RelE/ParE family toxin [uncultured Cetobacterium sp.]|uniref:type II toxin-antitoxin system RelE/ParE family toxin n=1 Tax=uncultured Cetobacterium sp. TaxID=527638 RepID=UPI0025CD971E|nr:type II toxin-antitoxin system RelE/ParE family toxin [uncultured Cetobacterium sp.]
MILLFEISFYEKENGKIPVKDFLLDLELKMRAKALKEIEILQTFGSELREPHVKYMQDGIFELRIKSANNISRIFYFFFTKEKIILTNGFIKKTQKTPKKEIEKAIEYKIDYVRRNENEI